MVTIRDVANLAGVVPSTVSHVMNNTAPVSEATRRRVTDAIQKLGYRRNILASSLRQQTTHMIGLLVPNIAEPLYAEFVCGISEEAASAGYGIMLGHTNNNPQLEQRQLGYMLDRRVDGLIVIPNDEQRLQEYQAINIPLVTINRQTPFHSSDPPSVDIDNRRAGYLATRHLIGLGHTKIGMITATPDNERYIGYMMALKEAGITLQDALIANVNTTTSDLVAQGRMAMQSLLKKAMPTACFIVDDIRATGALDAIQHARLNVPHDIALVGCGDLRVATLIHPKLTTIGHSKRQIGVQAIRILLDTIQGKPTEAHSVVPIELIVRESCGAIQRPT
ncbi:MAG: LacI family DNA-binding transcriptional regulator [Roseiflexaceae bacterium]|nr:LacI family DNA-binding transcriptional regulator [Roseiflexaceae bacterium]